MPSLKTIEDWERLDVFRMESAVREIVKSPNLRFFFRSMFNITGVTGTPTGIDPHSMAQSVGRHSVGTDLIQTLMEHQPQLFGELLVEDAEEGVARNKLNEDLTQ